MIHFFRLVRPVNLFIIALTMVGVRLYLCNFVDAQQVINLPFVLLVVSTLLIAAGGNVINDYFDIRADRVNRPQSVIIGKYIKRRWAIIIHWIFNLFGFCVGLYLGWLYDSFFFVIVHVSSITFLWWYSVSLKKKPLIGNVVVSILAVFVILLVYQITQLETLPLKTVSIYYDRYFMIPVPIVLIIFMIMAFTQNISREIIKDVEDVKGDLVIGARTIPMIMGEKRTIRLIGILLIIFPLIYFYVLLTSQHEIDFVKTSPITLAALVNVVLLLIAFFVQPKQSIKLIKNLLKLSMVLGVIYLFIPQ